MDERVGRATGGAAPGGDLADLRRTRAMRKVLPRWYRALCEVRWHATTRRAVDRAARRHRWIFVSGVNRSGKTTLTNLFANHPRVTVVPNASNMSAALPNSISEGCPHVWMERRARFRLTEDDVPRVDHRRLVFDWLTFRWRPGPVIVVESDLPAVQTRWLQAVLPTARFIGMVRNGYAVAQGLRLKEGFSIERCARQWSHATELMLDDAAVLRHFLLVTYEEFTAAPLATAARIAAFIGIDVEPVQPFIASGWRLGNDDRVGSALRNANAELIGALSAEDRTTVRRVAGRTLERLSYAIDPEGAGEPAATAGGRDPRA